MNQHLTSRNLNDATGFELVMLVMNNQLKYTKMTQYKGDSRKDCGKTLYFNPWKSRIIKVEKSKGSVGMYKPKLSVYSSILIESGVAAMIRKRVNRV